MQNNTEMKNEMNITEMNNTEMKNEMNITEMKNDEEIKAEIEESLDYKGDDDYDTIFEKRMNTLEKILRKMVISPRIYSAEKINVKKSFQYLLFGNFLKIEDEVDFYGTSRQFHFILAAMNEIPKIIFNKIRFLSFTGLKNVVFLLHKVQKNFLQEEVLQILPKVMELNIDDKDKEIYKEMFQFLYKKFDRLISYINNRIGQQPEILIEAQRRRLPLRITSPVRIRQQRSGCVPFLFRKVVLKKVKPAFDEIGLPILETAVSNNKNNSEIFFAEARKYSLCYFDVNWSYNNTGHVAAGIFVKREGKKDLIFILNTHLNSSAIQKTFLEIPSEEFTALHFPIGFFALLSSNEIPVPFNKESESLVKQIANVNEETNKEGANLEALKEKRYQLLVKYIEELNIQTNDFERYQQGQCQDWSILMGYSFVEKFQNKQFSVQNLNEFYAEMYKLSQDSDKVIELQRKIGFFN